MLAGPLSVVALIAGWVVTEVGRQPWVVYHVMPTDAAVTGAHGIPVGYAALAGAYLVVGCGVAWVLQAARARAARSRTRCRTVTGGGVGAMLLKALPLTFVLAGLALYTALAGADFGAGFWQLFAGRGERAERIRAHAHRSMGPVWEANHVWLIFVLTVFWTSYPRAFGSIASTLSVPLFIAALGIILRGAAYALRAGASGARESGVIDTIFSVSSVLTPFALGAAIGAIATGRVPVGNASRAPVLELAEPDLDLHRRGGRGELARIWRPCIWRPTRPGLASVPSSKRSDGERWAPGRWPARLRLAASSWSTATTTGSFTRC